MDYYKIGVILILIGIFLILFNQINLNKKPTQIEQSKKQIQTSQNKTQIDQSKYSIIIFIGPFPFAISNDKEMLIKSLIMGSIGILLIILIFIITNTKLLISN